MIELLKWIKTIRESTGDAIIISLGGFIASIITWIYTKAKRRRERQFSTASTDSKIKAFRLIGELESTNPNPQSENIKNTLIQGVGIFIPWAWSNYIFRYTREKGIADDDNDLNAYLKNPQLMNIGKDEFSWNNSKFLRRHVEAWIVMLCVTILLLGMSLTSLSQVANAEDAKYIALFLFSFITFISWFILFIGFITETERLNGAKRFNNKFTPWLRRKLAEER